MSDGLYSNLEEDQGLRSGPLEEAEQLEQLRFLEAGKYVLVTEVDARGFGFWELNNPEDIERIEGIMAQNERIRLSATA